MPHEQLEQGNEISQAIERIEEHLSMGAALGEVAENENAYRVALTEFDQALALADSMHLRKQYESAILHGMKAVYDKMKGKTVAVEEAILQEVEEVEGV